ncbi:fibrocystin-L-like [Mytilus californianus]|uniref:fibrocystin-L-like n=1 Tax=Mytilus californianus TaxID=6549 RepID=UPI002244FE8F|nr:fibrocystin-L-like [Mytilus californianus]
MSPTIFEVLGGGILTISVSNFASNGTLKIGSTDVPIATINGTHITAVMPSLPPGTYEVLVFNESNGAGVHSDGSRPSIQYQLSITNVFPRYGSMYGGTRLTLTGQGFSAETPKDKIAVSIGSHNCGVESVSSSQIVCLIDETAAVIKINNQGVHPHWGIGYQWNPLVGYLEAGDIVEWTWTSQPWILTFTHRIEQTKSESSTDRASDGFISSTKGTYNGMFRYQVTTPGEFQYWSGYTDYYEIVYYRGTLMVTDKQPFVANVSVKIGEHEAFYTTNSGISDPVDTSNCPGLNSLTCQDLPDLSPSSIFQFSFDMCHSPTITLLGRDNATAVDTVTIFGSGFSTTACNNEVTFGDANCIVKKATESSIECMIDSSNSPMIAVRQDVAVRVNNLGYALLAVEGQTARTLVVLPVVTSISPEMVSTNGGAVVNIMGAGFQGDTSDITVIINGYNCPIQYVSYTEINCIAPPSGFGTKSLVVKISVNDMTIPAVCDTECQLVYESAVSPELSDITPTSLNGDVTTLTITGSGFSTVVRNAVVKVGDVSCSVEAVKDSQIACTITHAPVGDLAVDVVINDKGRATKSKTFFVTSQPVISNISPTQGSIYGGTEIVITGNGFINEKTVVSIGGSACDIKETNLSRIVCVTRSGSEGNASVAVVSNSVTYAEWRFEYSSAVTPIISVLSPLKGTKGTSLVITGSTFGSSDGENKVTVGNAPCEITFYNMTMIECTISEGSIGTATVLVIVEGLGVSNSDVQFEFEFAVTGIQKSSGSVSGGQTITVIGSGFDNTTDVTICGKTCTADDKANQSASEFICVTPPSADVVTGTKSCDVITTVDGVQKPMGGGYTYSQALTPDITSVSPARGGTGGGVFLTIGGTGFGIDKSVVVVKIAGTPCNVSTVTDTEIVCLTGKHSPSQKTKVWVEINGNGMATQTNAEFFYIDVWSSPYTWGGLDPPEDGTLVVIPAGNIILLDKSTARLKMILIKGGELVFDEKDIELFADNILIVEGGRLQIGTESEPFQHKAYITGTAHLRTKELPIYGTNSLGVREGVLDLHGKPVPVVWTHLASTAAAGSNTITLEREVTWQSGDEIVIATTGGPSSQRQNEKHTIKEVTDMKTLTLVNALKYEHLGESETIGSHTFEYRAEVGLLTRNIVLRGERDRQWTEIIPACPRGFSTGEFATQTCFQGRFGEEIGSDEFGLQVMFHPPEPNKNLTIGRVSYVEFTYVGQAFRLGRYPFHLHLAGDMSSTYIKGCSIHESFNRGVNIHGSHNALVENNVIYNTKGGTVFLEDGIETGNKLLYNLVIFVRESSSLVNDDITPASFWITHPDNFVEHNVAVGGTHFGFWYRMHTHPDGPSSTTSVCPQRGKLGSFSHNTAHSFGWYGFWIFTTYTPRTDGSCWSGTPQPTVFDNFYAWRNRKGAESVKAGALQFHNFTLVSNSEAGYEEITHLEGEWYSQNGALFKNGVIVGTSSLGGCTASGISLPDNFGFMVDGTEFINFNGGCTAFSVKHATDHNAPGGFHYRTQNLKFTNVGPTNGASIAEFEASFMDLDGTAKTNIPGSIIAPTTDMHPPNCTDFEFFSAGVPMSLCTINVLRFSFNNLQRGGLYRGPIRFENQYGNTTINWERMYVTHPLGYMIMISTREEYTMHFDNTKLNTNVSFSGTLTLFNADDWLIFTIELGGTPDCVYVFDRVCRKNGTEMPLDPEEHFNGDWYYDKSTGAVSFLVSRKGRGSLTGVQYNLNFQCFKCYFKDCIVPPKPETVAPVDTTLGGVDDAMTWWGLGLKRWSDPTIWPNNTIPQEGDDVAIECGTWVLADIEIPPLGELFICGVLEFDNENYTEGYKNFTVNVTRIIIYGGRLIVGWEKRPFMGNFLITLRGNASDETYELPNGGDNIGSKVIGVYGGLDLHGKPINMPWTTLNTTAYPDDSTIKLNTVVDWEVEQEIVVTPTGYSAWETETFQITNVEESDGMSILTLNDTIQYRHLAYNDNGVDITAEVGLLTRNVKVQSEDYPDLYEEKYGGRLIVGQTEFSKGYARISNTEFYHMGQDGKNYRKVYDPRFAVSFVDSGPVNYIRPSYIRNCSFHNGFSPAIGIFNALYLPIEDNVIHGSHFYAIITDSYGTIIRRNVVTMTQNLEADLLGAISAADATDLVLENNRVSGSERAAYDIAQPCNASSSKWYSGNIGRSSLYGVITTQAEIYCNRICGFILVKCGYYGVYYDGGVSVVFENLVLADNPISISITITGPSATSHQYADKTAIVNNSVIVGTSPVFDCYIDRVNKSEKGIEPLLKKGPFGQRIGIPFATFSSGSKSPMAIRGLLTIENVEFRNFTTACSSRDNAITTNPSNNDGAHPVETSNIKFQNVERKHKIYFHRPNLGLINPADCVDMDCDGLKKGFLKDLDGTFLGTPGTPGTILPQSEWEWDGDPQRGLGDYRVPKTMLTMLNGTRIPMSTLAPMKGIIRENGCVYESDWNAYVCREFDYLMMVIESMDSDSTSRRLSPVALLGHNSDGEGVIDLMNGPQDHGWCSGYACKSRLSTFQAIVATGKNYQLYFTSTSPRSSRYFLLNADDSQAVRIAVWYSQPYRMDVYYQKKLVLPVNGRFGIDNAYILSPPPVGKPFAYHPNATKDPAGTNWFDRDSGLLYFVVRGSDPISIVTTKQIIVSFMYPAMTASDFYGERIVELLAAFFDLPPSKVRVVNIVSAQQNKRRRRKRSTERDQIVVEIGDVPNDDFNTTADDAITEDQLQQMYAKIVTEGEVGNISEIVNATVLGLGVAEPTLDPSDPKWSRVTTDDGYRILIQVDHLDFETTTLSQYEGTIFPRQPKICAYDKGGDKINDLGTDLYPWNITATLRQGTGNPDGVLSGNTTVPFVNGEANFSNLEISHPGMGYIIDFNMTEPIEAENLTLASVPLDIQKIPVTAVIVSATEDVYTTESMVIQMELREELTGNKLDNIGWRSHEWNVQADMGTPEYYNGSLHASNQKFWGSSSQATFSDLTFTSFGMAIINFHVTTNPPEYNFTIPHFVNVKQLQHKSMTHEETNDIVLKIDGDYNTVVGSDDRYAKAMFGNWFAVMYEDLQINSVSLQPGSILVTLNVSGSHDSINSSLYSTCSMLTDGQTINYNGQALELSKYMYYNDSVFYGEACEVIPDNDDSSEVPMAIIVGSIVGCVLLIVIILVVWRMKSQSKNKIQVTGGLLSCGCGTGSNEKDTDEILYRERSFMSVTGPKESVSRDQSFVSSAPSSTEFKAPRLSQAWNSNF